MVQQNELFGNAEDSGSVGEPLHKYAPAATMLENNSNIQTVAHPCLAMGKHYNQISLLQYMC